MLIDHWVTTFSSFLIYSAFIGPINWARHIGQSFLFLIQFSMQSSWKKWLHGIENFGFTSRHIAHMRSSFGYFLIKSLLCYILLLTLCLLICFFFGWYLLVFVMGLCDLPLWLMDLFLGLLDSFVSESI